MAHGGARNRSGPPADPSSGRSDARGFTLTTLPAEGFEGDAPDWPLAVAPSAAELAAWLWAWSTPQACAWSLPSEEWRIPFVAQWARLHVRCSEPDAPGNLFASLFRLEDRIGLSTAGLAEMGWRVAVDETATRRAERSALAEKPKTSRDRMKVVKAGEA